MSFVAWLAAAYLLGSVPTSYWVARAFAGLDLRTYGSGNLGATNLYRALGWKAAIPVGAFDVAKGMLPTLIFAPAAGSQPWAPAALGAAAVLGHAFSPFVGFRGGKGVATAAGVLMVLAPASLAVSAGVWAALLAATGFMSLASVLAAAALPVAIALSGPENAYTLGVAILFAGFIAFTHRANLRRLVRGTEPRMRSHGAHS